MIQNQARAGLAPLGNFCNIAGRPVTSTPLSGAVLPDSEIVSAEGPEVFGHQVLLLKLPKDVRPAPDGFSNLRVSATPNHKESSYILLFRVHAPGYQTTVRRTNIIPPEIIILFLPTYLHVFQ